MKEMKGEIIKPGGKIGKGLFTLLQLILMIYIAYPVVAYTFGFSLSYIVPLSVLVIIGLFLYSLFLYVEGGLK